MNQAFDRLGTRATGLLGVVRQRLALRADRIAEDLGASLGMVAWDRERVLGRVQAQLAALPDRAAKAKGPGLVLERRRQPLEAIALAWAWLCRGQRVCVVAEQGACRAGLDLLAELRELVGSDQLEVGTPGAEIPKRVHDWERVGVEEARPRVARVFADGDAELAAYVLARACLRRTGFDPRAVHHAVVPEEAPLLERHLRRLWVGARMGPASEPGAFAGPVSVEQAEGYEAQLATLGATEGVETLIGGGRLTRLGSGNYLAPALFAAQGAGPDVAGDGPWLVLHRVPKTQADACLERLAGPRRGRIWVGPTSSSRPRVDDRRFEGALLLERLPPGLPKPRP